MISTTAQMEYKRRVHRRTRQRAATSECEEEGDVDAMRGWLNMCNSTQCGRFFNIICMVIFVKNFDGIIKIFKCSNHCNHEVTYFIFVTENTPRIAAG
jgi:hypothetical protein